MQITVVGLTKIAYKQQSKGCWMTTEIKINKASRSN